MKWKARALVIVTIATIFGANLVQAADQHTVAAHGTIVTGGNEWG
ncbi:hypothetical protein O7606_15710 [Micromonospora sp. WMMD882]|nr:hypothetical protein [Micromonospora sp. WMMD882]WBB77716.1 hypothetical protein O7606_15710 [Micromonospora sp. WMMD882]